MRTVIISLKDRQDRRHNIRNQFDTYNHTRFSFWDAARGDDYKGVFNGLSGGELGLWLSTLQLLEANLWQDSNDTLHIAEDDCTFSRLFFRCIADVERSLVESDIDVLFTDGWARGPLLEAVLKETPEKGVRILPGQFYGGRTTSYLINPSRQEHVRQTLAEGLSQMERGLRKCEPIDGFYRRCQAEKKA